MLFIILNTHFWIVNHYFSSSLSYVDKEAVVATAQLHTIDETSVYASTSGIKHDQGVAMPAAHASG